MSDRPTIRFFPLIGFLLLTIGGGLAIGYLIRPGEWYHSLTKPSYTPAPWVFGPAWTFLYVLIAISGYRTWLADRRGKAMWAWWGQLALNFLWTPVFFGLHRPGLGVIVIALLLCAICLFMRFAIDRVSIVLFAPYVAWTSFALVLNTAIFRMN